MDHVDFEEYGSSELKIFDFGFVLKKLKGYSFVLDPPFQRKYVLNERDESKLIGDIYGGCDIGRFIFNKVSERGETKYLCIDGKQKLTALRKFRNNEFSFRPGNRELFYRDMSKSQKKKFKEQLVPIRTYDNMDAQKQSALFRSIQRGKSLKKGEILNGTNCEVARIVNTLRRHVPLDMFTEAVKNRMDDSTPLLRLVILCVKGSKENTNPKDIRISQEEDCYGWSIEATIKENKKTGLCPA